MNETKDEFYLVEEIDRLKDELKEKDRLITEIKRGRRYDTLRAGLRTSQRFLSWLCNSVRDLIISPVGVVLGIICAFVAIVYGIYWVDMSKERSYLKVIEEHKMEIGASVHDCGSFSYDPVSCTFYFDDGTETKFNCFWDQACIPQEVADPLDANRIHRVER